MAAALLARWGLSLGTGWVGFLARNWKWFVMLALFAWAMGERHAKIAVRQAAVRDALTISEALNDEDKRRVGAQGKVSDDDQKREADRLAGDTRTAGALGVLNARLAQAARREQSDHSTIADLRASAATARELFGACAAEYRELGGQAALARQRGLAAEGYYEALTPKEKP